MGWDGKDDARLEQDEAGIYGGECNLVRNCWQLAARNWQLATGKYLAESTTTTGQDKMDNSFIQHWRARCWILAIAY